MAVPLRHEPDAPAWDRRATAGRGGADGPGEWAQWAERAVAELAAGRPVIVVGAAGGSLVLAAATADSRQVGFMVRHGSGFVCVALPEPVADRLRLPPMAWAAGLGADATGGGVPTVTVDAASGVGTGISAADRAVTLRLLGDPATRPEQLGRPGHVVPVRVPGDGAPAPASVPAAALDLVLGGGLGTAAAYCELVGVQDPTRMADVDECRQFADEHGLAVVSVRDVTRWRMRPARLHPVAGRAGDADGQVRGWPA